eukprot:6403422-Prymnesium_polylepis.1
MHLGTHLAEKWAVGTPCARKAAVEHLGSKLPLPFLLCRTQHCAVLALPLLIALHIALVLCALLGLL